MKKSKRKIGPSEVLGFIGSLAIPTMGLFIVTSVSARIIFKKTFLSINTWVGFLALILVFFNQAAGFRESEYVRVEAVYQHLTGRLRTFVDIFSILFGMAICCVLIWIGLSDAISDYNTNSRPLMIAMPLWPWRLIIPLGCAFLLVDMSRRLVLKVKHFFSPSSQAREKVR